MNILEVKAVSCSNKGTYDAEVQLKWGDFEKPFYKQVVVSTGHASSNLAKEAVKAFVEQIENDMVQVGIKALSAYPAAEA